MKRTLQRHLTVACLVGAIGATRLATAQPSDRPSTKLENDKSAQLYVEGGDAYGKGDYARAEVSFRAAWAIKKHWQIAWMLGECESRLGKPTEAAQHLSIALAMMPPDEPKRPDLVKALTDAKTKVHTVALTIEPAGAEILVNGATVGTAPLTTPIFLNGGASTIEVRKPGFETERLSVEGAPGAQLERHLQLHPNPSKPPPDAHRPVWPPIVLGVVAAAGVGLGIGLVVASVGEHSDAEDLANQCATIGCDEAAGTDLLDSSDRLLGGGVAGFSIAAAALVGLTVYLALPQPKHERARLVPIVAPTALGLSLQGTF